MSHSPNKPTGSTGLPGGVAAVDPQATWLEVARVGRPHGLRGELRVQAYNPDSEVWCPGQRLRAWIAGKPAVLLEIAEFRDIPPVPVVAFRGITDRDQAALLTHALLSVDASELPETDEDEFYLHELIGATVLDDATREPVGTVRGILESPADVLEITLTAGGGALVPVNADAITELGRQKGVLVVRDIMDWSDR